MGEPLVITDRDAGGGLAGAVLRRRLQTAGHSAWRVPGGDAIAGDSRSIAAAGALGLPSPLLRSAPSPLVGEGRGGGNHSHQPSSDTGVPGLSLKGGGESSVPHRVGETSCAPRIALLTGPCVGYPYYAYYSHALLSLGLTYVAVDAAAIAAGALDEADVLVVPGGFAIWGLDRAEDAPGADRAAQRFLDRGGGYVGSCGGAYYAGTGRPGWAALADAKAKYTHEYLQTGAGVVNVGIDHTAFADGVGAHIEVPYYHGPAWVNEGTNAARVATFESLALPSRLFIDNPLDRVKFEADLAGRPAALLTQTGRGRGRGVLFSMHPEMGEIVRRHIALDGYVRKYLPIRGEKVLDDTLRHYAPEDAAAYRLIDRAVDAVAPAGRGAMRAPAEARDTARLAQALYAGTAALRRAIDALDARLAVAGAEDRAWSGLVAEDLARTRKTLESTTAALDARCRLSAPVADVRLPVLLASLLDDAQAPLAGLGGRTVIEALALIELPVRILVAAERIVLCDDAIGSVAPPP